MTTEIQWLDGNKWLEGRTKTLGKAVETPLAYRKPRRMTLAGDLFHEAVPDVFVDRVFAVMALCPQHKFMILTKRAERMRDYLAAAERIEYAEGWAGKDTAINRAAVVMAGSPCASGFDWPLPNVHLGVSVESQATADERVPLLLQTPAAVRFVSYEPALGPVDWMPCFSVADGNGELSGPRCKADGSAALDLIIAGGESGPGAWPAHPDWFRSTRDQCAEAKVAYFFKQWGEHRPSSPEEWAEGGKGYSLLARNGEGGATMAHAFAEAVAPQQAKTAGVQWMRRVGKKAAGRLLDGRTHDDLGVKA